MKDDSRNDHEHAYEPVPDYEPGQAPDYEPDPDYAPDHEPEPEPSPPIKASVPSPTTGPMVNPFQVFRQRNMSTTVVFRGDLIKCDHRSGEWTRTSGDKATLISADTHFIVNPLGLVDTWTKFVKGKPEEHSRKIYRAINFEFAPPREDLGDLDETKWEWEGNKHKDPWQRCVYLPMKLYLNGNDTEVCAFKATGTAAIEEISELCDMYGSADRVGKLPVIVPRARHFKNYHGSVIHVPVFKLVDWAFWEPNLPTPPLPLRPASTVAPPAPRADKPALAKPKARNNETDDDVTF